MKSEENFPPQQNESIITSTLNIKICKKKFGRRGSTFWIELVFLDIGAPYFGTFPESSSGLEVSIDILIVFLNHWEEP